MPTTPELTDFDRRVLARTPTETGLRDFEIAQAVYRRPATIAEIREVRLILRGLEHFRLVKGAGGWWRRLELPEPEQLALGE